MKVEDRAKEALGVPGGYIDGIIAYNVVLCRVKAAIQDAEAEARREEQERLLDCEVLAAVQHEIWSHWVRHQFDCMLESGEGVIPKDKLTRWERQMNTRYADLPEDEKESDRHQADKVIATVLAHSEEAPGG